MSDDFKIYIDRLRNEEIDSFKFEIDPSFLDINENELTFDRKILISGKSYLADDNLVIDLNAKTYYNMPCAFCSELIEKFLQIEHFTQVISLDTIKDAIFNFSDILRNEILLNIPQFIECDLNQCKERKNLAKYLKKDPNEGYYPFKEL
jgi:DUF177 domain-containing protein